MSGTYRGCPPATGTTGPRTCGPTGPGNLPGGPRNVAITAEVFPFLAAGGAPRGDALTIRPARIPAGDAILIEVAWFPGDGGSARTRGPGAGQRQPADLFPGPLAGAR